MNASQKANELLRSLGKNEALKQAKNDLYATKTTQDELFCHEVIRTIKNTKGTFKRQKIKPKPVYSSIPKKPRKKTGELNLFLEIWSERPHKSQVSGTPLQFDVRCFSHLLSKGAYPSLRLVKENIVLKTPQEHHDYQFNEHKIKDLPEWKWVFEKKAELKLNYYEQD